MRHVNALKLLLRIIGGTGLFALIAVCIPMSWMMITHRWLGLGEMPNSPIVEYLARTVSAFYALVSAFCLILAADLNRYRPLVRPIALLFALFGIVLIGTDLAAGMPIWWTVSEGPMAIVFGALMFFLARHDQ
jgi:hypothetical protein